MQQSFTPSLIELTPAPSTRNVALALIAALVVINSALTITLSDTASRMWFVLAVHCAAAGAVYRVWQWRPVRWLGLSAHGDIYIDSGSGRLRATTLPPSILCYGFCYLQLRADNRTWHVLLKRCENSLNWRFAQVLWRWHPEFDR